MKILITENQLRNLTNILINEEESTPTNVNQIQQELVDKGYYIGNFGEKGDGVDGKYGRMTRGAHEAMKNGISPEEYNKTVNKNNKSQGPVNNNVGNAAGNIIIGDSQTTYVDNATSKASRLSTEGGTQSLWKGGMGVSWLVNALNSYPVSPNIKNVVVVIGTNGGFRGSVNELMSSLKRTFPNAKFFVVQGSWGWGGNKGIQPSQVQKYYSQFSGFATIIEPPIGVIEPHGDFPVYKQIGASIDSYL
jgi:hypothetical protein